MASEDIKEALKQAAIRIRDEKQAGANTALRVGSLLLAICEALSLTPDELEKNFLRKDQPDTAAGLITFLKGLFSKDDVIIGTDGYAEGMTGFGTKFGRDGSGEMSRLTLRHELRVPSLVFNQTEVNVGDKWRAPGGGVIEMVFPDVDEEGNLLNTGTFFIKLEKGQIGAVFTGAICMGIFHDWQNNDNNATEDTDDSRGNRSYAGFATSYFTITEVSDYTEEGVTYHRKLCRYQLRPVSDRWSGQAHPYEQMNFVCYGIFSADADMLKKYGTSVYETRTYRRMLWNQNTWEISAANIAYQDGDLSNLNVHGMDMVGYSAYLNSVYFTGSIKQVKPDGTPVQTANDRGDWVSGEKYDFYDRVSHNGGLWLCINESGTNSEPIDGDPSWLCQVKPGTSVKAAGRWEAKNVPYPANSIVTFADKVWISNKETSEPPFGTYMDKDSNRLVYKDGSYVLTETLIQSEDWDLLLDAPQLTDGKDGDSLQVRYSSDKSNWHVTFVEGDVWMQQRVGEGSIWSDPIRIAGEAGAVGADGTYYDYQFAVNDSLDIAPATGWQDTPPAVGIGQYLWMRTRFVDPNSEEENPWSAARIGGEKGRGVETVTEYYAVSASNSEAPAEWVKDKMPELTETLKYLWNYEEIRYTDTGVTTTQPIVVGMFSKDGNGIKSVTEYYGLSNDPDTQPTEWYTDMLIPTQQVRYLWNKAVTEYTQSRTDETIRIIAVYGEKGEQGIPGKDGVGFTLMEQWKTGVTMPVMGVVSMGGCCFASLIATNNPPLWCWTDKDGNRLIMKDGSYLLTGESNTSEFQLWSVSGAPGEQGPQGIPGVAGVDGKTYYTWIRYADDEKGSGISNSPSGKAYIGFAYNKPSADESNNPSDYKWSKIEGEQGVPGERGADGIQYYTWIAYSDNANGSGMYQQPKDSTKYIGIAVNKTTQTEGVDPSEYTWSLFKGADGESFTPMGNWKTGLAVPALGVVTMAGGSFLAKNATVNPPLWCWTDKDGNRLIISATEYFLTGEVNTSEYDRLAEKGEDGKDGADGQKGDKGDTGAQGEQGIQGCISRDSEWVLGTQYRNDEALTSGTRYIDVVLVRNDSAATGWDAYKCKVTHTSTAATAPGNTTYWEQFGSNVAAIFTSLIIAKNAKIRFLQGNQLLMQKNNGTVTAGLSGSEEGDKTRIWAGSDSPDNAPFAVNEEGVTTSTKFRTARSGLRLEASNGLIKVFGNMAKNIEFGVNDEGLAVMRYYDNDGTLLYDLGPKGISSIKRDNDTWVVKRLTYLGTGVNDLFDLYWDTAKNPLYITGHDRWQFLSGFIGNIYDDAENHRKIFKSNSKKDSSGNSNVIDDGWYCDSLPRNVSQLNRVQYPNIDDLYPDDISSMNPNFDLYKPIYVTSAFYIQDGLIINRMNVYYNL